MGRLMSNFFFFFLYRSIPIEEKYTLVLVLNVFILLSQYDTTQLQSQA
jgi:hypothetical protein